ncbi:hypothetical protein F4604DRAFT_1920486 [Suillus subluteus]|nr:hypothetical protein F4604DRAFT_1920486 [Suillus subluteus]
MGFDWMPGQPGPEVLDMGFTLEFDNTPLHMGFHPLPVHDGHPDQRPLDMALAQMLFSPWIFSQMCLWTWDSRYTIRYIFIRISQAFGHGIRDTPSVDIQPDDRPLDMGFGTDPACDIAHQPVDIQPEDAPLDMGFKTFHPGHVHPDQSFMVGEPEPIRFVIQRALGDLHLAINWLEMDMARGTMSPEEASVSEEVLLSTHELLLAFQLISVYRLST